jgi:hypothetical protein
MAAGGDVAPRNLHDTNSVPDGTRQRRGKLHWPRIAFLCSVLFGAFAIGERRDRFTAFEVLGVWLPILYGLAMVVSKRKQAQERIHEFRKLLFAANQRRIPDWESYDWDFPAWDAGMVETFAQSGVSIVRGFADKPRDEFADGSLRRVPEDGLWSLQHLCWKYVDSKHGFWWVLFVGWWAVVLTFMHRLPVQPSEGELIVEGLRHLALYITAWTVVLSAVGPRESF